jgi:high-affinity Fe2+/Pb2+ permease
MIDLTSVFQAVIALAVAVVTAFVIPWIKSKTTMQQREMLLSITSCLVYAAEQMYGAGHGDEKLAYVISQLEERGYTADIAAIEAII